MILMSGIDGYVGNVYRAVGVVHRLSPLKSPAEQVSKIVQVVSSIGAVMRSGIVCHVGSVVGTGGESQIRNDVASLRQGGLPHDSLGASTTCTISPSHVYILLKMPRYRQYPRAGYDMLRTGFNQSLAHY
jgi:hypothetical protein